jgi:signal transduction histidine kinase
MFKSRSIGYVFLLFVATTMLMTGYNFFVVYPSYTELLISNKEDEAVRTGSHLATLLRHQLIYLDSDLVPPDIPGAVEELRASYNFTKVKLFSKSGETVYSTDPVDIGNLNEHPYFHNKVAQGNTYTEVVEQESLLPDREQATNHVVDTYVPIMSNDFFIGAFEVYYDITHEKQALDAVVSKSSVVHLLAPILGIVIILILLIQLDKSITRQKETEKELKHYAERLRVSNHELEHFAHIASHDLQEPLRKVMAFGDRLTTKYADVLDDRGRDYLERMQSATKRMQNLITGLLNFSRVTTKAQPFVPVDLTKMTQEVIADLDLLIERSKAKLQVKDLTTIHADPLQMRQLLQNLIGNAVKFAQANESPSIKIHGKLINSNGNEEDRADSKKSEFQFIVEDNGIGFEQKYADRIFGVFQRLHGRREFEGTGIGLSICRRIVERHEGVIEAKGNPGQGASFIVTLPTMHETGADDEYRS